MNNELRIISMPGSHDHIIGILEKQEKGRILDSPSGSGALSQRLVGLGFDVSCCDIDAGNFQLHDNFTLDLADFNQDRLPYEDKYFDYIVCANGLHRLFYPANILQEFSRVIKDDGLIILSWPNYNSMARRIKYILSGSLGSSIDHPKFEQTIKNPAAKLRFPLSSSRMQHLLANEHLSIDSIESVGLQKYDYLLYPVSFLFSVISKLLGKKINNDFSVIKGGTTTIAVCKKILD